MRVRKSYLASWLLAAGLLGGTGCGRSAGPPVASVAQEQLFRTGNFNYDEFFEDVNTLQLAVHESAADEKATRAPLGRVLGIGDDAPRAMLLERLGLLLEGQAQSKAHVQFIMEGVDPRGAPLAGKSITVTAGAAKGHSVPKEIATLARATERAAGAAGLVWEKYGFLAEKGRRLSAKAVVLSSEASAAFASEPEPKRVRVDAELKAAKVVTLEIAGRCDEVVKSAGAFVKQTREIIIAAEKTDANPSKEPTRKSRVDVAEAAPSLRRR
jgi:hypothetical protein